MEKYPQCPYRLEKRMQQLGFCENQKELIREVYANFGQKQAQTFITKIKKRQQFNKGGVKWKP